MTSNEIEAKFLIEDPSQTATLIQALTSDELNVLRRPTVEVVDRYFDTKDWQILHAGWAYRWREASGKRRTCLKSVAISDDAVQTRVEVEDQVDAFPDNGRGLQTGQVAQTLGPISCAKLRELFRVFNRRQLLDVRTREGALIEVAIDHVTVTPADSTNKREGRSLVFEELELELKEGDEQSLRTLAKSIGKQSGLLPSRLSKFERGLQCVGLSPPSHVRPETRCLEEAEGVGELHTRKLRKKDPVNALAYGYLLTHFEQMLRYEPIAWEGLDAEGVHQMRVATRRIRAALRAFKRVLPANSTKSLSTELQWIADVLGNVRDLDVFDDNFEHDLAEIPAEDAKSLIAYRQYILEQRQLARRTLVASFCSQRYRKLKADFAELLQSGAYEVAHPSSAVQSIGDAAIRSIRRQYKRLLCDGRKIKRDSPDKALHALRIDCKRMRYLLEFFQPTYGKSLRPFIRQLTKLQDVLGEFQDACVGERRLRQYANCVPMQQQNRSELIAVGQLINAQRRLATDRRAAFHGVWKRFDRNGRRKQIVAVLK